MRLRKFSIYSAAVIFIILAALAIWGFLIEPRLVDVKRETALIPGLPPEWEGKKIGLIADLQVGMWWSNTGTVGDIVNKLIAERPAAVLLAGDFIYRPTGEDERSDVREEFEQDEFRDAVKEIDTAVALVRPLVDAQIPTYAVLGNHDYGMMNPEDVRLEWLAEETSQRLAAVGVVMLENDAVPVSLGQNMDDPLYFVGVGSRYARNDDVTRALGSVPDGAPRIAFMHNPDSMAQFPAGTAPLALAAHTHGGQIRLPLTPDWSWISLVRQGAINTSGWIGAFGEAGNSLYVNRGIGFSMVPVRINCRPEMTLITLHRAN